MKEEKYTTLRITVEEEEKEKEEQMEIREEVEEEEEKKPFNKKEEEKKNKLTREEQKIIRNLRKKIIPKEVESYVKKPISIKPMYGEPLLNRGDILDKKWKIKALIGEGTFGQIYIAENIHNTTLKVAIKCEAIGKQPVETLRVESIILKKTQESPHVPRFIHAGITKHFRFLIMGLCGQNLHYINVSERFEKAVKTEEEEEITALMMSPSKKAPRSLTRGTPYEFNNQTIRKTAKRKLPMGATLEYGIQMLRCIKSFHKLGFIHRDIKPSNFVINASTGKLMLIDFNLARRYVNAHGEMKKARDHAGFRGTGRYASIKAHLKKDLGRVDDLWSMYYSLIELAGVYLPWSQIADYDEILKLKQQHAGDELTFLLPPQFSTLNYYLKSLHFEDEPDYDFIESLFKKTLLSTITSHSAPVSPTLLVASSTSPRLHKSRSRGISLPLSPLQRFRSSNTSKPLKSAPSPHSKKNKKKSHLFPPIHSSSTPSSPSKRKNNLLPSIFKKGLFSRPSVKS